MPMPKVLLSTMTALLLFNTSCAVKIKDYTFCAEIPGGLGATCDNFLTANQQILTEAEWQAMKASWVASGNAVECTSSQSVGDLKAEIEKLCSKYPCNYPGAKQLMRALKKMHRTAQRSVNSSLPSTSTSVAE